MDKAIRSRSPKNRMWKIIKDWDLLIWKIGKCTRKNRKGLILKGSIGKRETTLVFCQTEPNKRWDQATSMKTRSSKRVYKIIYKGANQQPFPIYRTFELCCFSLLPVVSHKNLHLCRSLIHVLLDLG